MKRFAFACAALAAAFSSAAAQTPANRFAALRDTVRAVMAPAAQNVPAIAVAVSKDGQILWEEGFGLANIEKKTPVTPSTMFSLASISKPFTATALMTLVEEGRIDIDKPANDYLGTAKLRAMQGSAVDATVRRLLTHTSGLPLHYQFFYEGIATAHSNDDAIAKYGVLVNPPGETYFYSNLGFGIIDHIVARTAGTSYESFMQAHVFLPLDLRNTTVSTGAKLGERAAIRYDADNKPIPPYAFDHTGASGVWSSAHDLVRFGMFHLLHKQGNQKQILTPATIRRMQESHAPTGAPGQAYGLGWGIAEDDGGYRRVSHTGGMPGVSTVLNLFPSEGVAIVVLANKSTPAVGRIANAIAGEMLPRYAEARAAAAAAARARGPGAPTPLSFTEIAGAWRGTVLVGSDTIPLRITVRADNDVHVRLGDQPETILTGAAFNNGVLTGRFVAPLRPPDATPAAERLRVAVQLTLKLRGDKLTGWVSSMTAAPPVYGAVSYYAEVRRGGQ